MRRSLFVGVALLLVAILLLPWAPSLLTRRDPLPKRADALYVFPGKLETRAKCAARLFREGHAPLVVFTGGRVRPELRALGLPMSDAALGARFAAQHGVPLNAEVILEQARSTWEDAATVSAWSRTSGAKTIIAVTSPAHSRRAGEALRLALAPLGAEVYVASCEPGYGRWSPWWWHEKSLVEISNEFLKLGLYVVRYFVPTWLGIRPPPGGSTMPERPHDA